MAIIPAEEKVFMVSNSTNTTYSGSAALKAMQQWYTMEDVTNTVRPYQVFTALLTQSGGDDPAGLNSGSLTIGVTYLIQLLEGADFSNVGGNNIEGEYFVATGTTPNSWGIGGQLEYNTGAPVATVLENTIGNVWFTYDSEGNYGINCNGLFDNNTFIPFPMGNCNAVDGGVYFQIYNISNSKLGIVTYNNGFNPINDILSNSPIEIRVYN
jgi:hypothetical protein